MLSYNLVDILTLRNVLKVAMVVILFGYVGYTFLMMMRVRILSQTLNTVRSAFVYTLARIHFFGALIGSLIVVLLVLL